MKASTIFFAGQAGKSFSKSTLGEDKTTHDDSISITMKSSEWKSSVQEDFLMIHEYGWVNGKY